MNSDSKFFLYVVVAAILVIGGIIWYSARPTAVVKINNVDISDAQKIGPDNAKVKIIEFGDLECPACAEAASGVRAAQASNSDVQLLFKNFPLETIHPNAVIAAQAGVAAGKQGKFWQFYDLMYANQSQWVDLSDPSAQLAAYATQLGMDATQFTIDMNAPATHTSVQNDYNYALKLGFDQTPTFLVNGVKYVGAQTTAQWNQIIATARK